jgi:hypothetical protein
VKQKRTEEEDAAYIRGYLEELIRVKGQKPHLVDNHARILFMESDLDLKRVSNLRNRWEAKAREGLLPKSSEIGIFDTLSRICSDHQRKMRIFFDQRILSQEDLYQKWTRSFEDIIELTDELKTIHLLIAIAERCYWQRMEGFEGGAIDAVRRGTVSEVGSVQQIYNAADFLCMSIGDRIMPFKNCSFWKGLTVFGQYNEFRHHEDYIFVPDYAKLHGFNLWLYFGHEIGHYAFIRKLRDLEGFARIFEELKAIFSAEPTLKEHAEPEYLAEETIADIMATLLVGEQYALILTNLKYYPPVIVGERKNYLQRFIQYPTLLRTLVCDWTSVISWGFPNRKTMVGEPTNQNDIIRYTINKVQEEDLIEWVRTALYYYQPLKQLRKKLTRGISATETRTKINEVLYHENELTRIVFPRILNKILATKIIPRIKSFVAKDFYETISDQHFYDVRLAHQKSMWREQVMEIHSACLVRTKFAKGILQRKKAKLKLVEGIKKRLLKGEIIEDRDPLDVICSADELSQTASLDRKTAWDTLAILAISHTGALRERRFAKLSADDKTSRGKENSSE